MKPLISTWLTVLAGAAFVGGVTYLTLPVKPKPTATIIAEYTEEQQWQIPSYVFEWSYKTNLNDPWRVYTNVVGTNTLVVERSLAQCFFTITRISLKDNTNIFIKRSN